MNGLNELNAINEQKRNEFNGLYEPNGMNDLNAIAEQAIKDNRHC